MRNGDRIVVAATGQRGKIAGAGVIHNAEKASDPFAERLFPVHLDGDPDGHDVTLAERALVPEGQWEHYDPADLADDERADLAPTD